jgi:hypothetical protein
MKKKRTGCIVIAILFGVALVVALVALYMFVLVPGTLEERRATSGPPSVFVHTPVVGDTLPANTENIARATITGNNPILKVELWIDGNLVMAQVPDLSDQTSFEAYTEFQIDEGTHMLSYRAIDVTGLVGQSLPIAVTGEAQAVVDEPAGGTAQDDANPPQDDQGQGDQEDAGAQGGQDAPGGQGDAGAQGGEANAGNAQDQPEWQADIGDQPPPGAWVAQEAKNIDWSRYDITLTQYPKAPSHLQVGYDHCMIYLKWNDNAENERGFNVWMQALGGPPQLIKRIASRPGTGQMVFEFAAPAFGIYSFWIEAANALGTQPSEIKGVAVSEDCSGGIFGAIATQLEIEALAMHGFNSNWDRIYCYISLEGRPEERIPEGDGHFDIIPNQGADIHTWFGGEHGRVVQMPADEVLNIEGKCMGWLGSDPQVNPQPMGIIDESIPKAFWDDRPLQIKAENFIIDYRIHPFGKTHVTKAAYRYTDYSIPSPVILSITPGSKTNRVIAEWDWSGPTTPLNVYYFFVNGKTRYGGQFDAPYGFSKQGKNSVFLPTSCGEIYQIQMTVNSGQARSPFSQVRIYEQPACPVMAEVRFDSVISNTTSDGSSACDQLSIHYDLFALGAGSDTKYIKGGTSQGPHPYQCGIEYDFVQQLGAKTNTIIVPINPNLPEVRLGTVFWDGGTRFGLTGEDIKYPYGQWSAVDEDFTLTAPLNGTADVTVKGHIRGFINSEP